MNNLELETLLLNYKKTLYKNEKELYVQTELLVDLLDRAATVSDADAKTLEDMIKATDKKITSLKLKIEGCKKAIDVLKYE